MSYVTGEHPDYGMLWAAIDQSAHHVQGRVCERRFAAFTHPFRTESEALQALLAAGATLEEPTAVKRDRRKSAL